ncbi:MAG: hypothetical protein OXC11_14400 [Rhodospirillales bacterium]|nr:hypothetical protein [Rhodospirillales bacterium]
MSHYPNPLDPERGQVATAGHGCGQKIDRTAGLPGSAITACNELEAALKALRAANAPGSVGTCRGLIARGGEQLDVETLDRDCYHPAMSQRTLPAIEEQRGSPMGCEGTGQ